MQGNRLSHPMPMGLSQREQLIICWLFKEMYGGGGWEGGSRGREYKYIYSCFTLLLDSRNWLNIVKQLSSNLKHKKKKKLKRNKWNGIEDWPEGRVHHKPSPRPANRNGVWTAAAKSLQSCLTLCDPIDGSPPGSPVPGILQARTLEWVAISFSSAQKWILKVKSLSRVGLLATPRTEARQAPPSMGVSRQEYWSG